MSMERESGARIQVPSRDAIEAADGKAFVAIIGSQEQVDKAAQLIQEVVDAPPVRSGPQVNIAGHKFSDKDALWTHCKQMVEALGDEAQLTGENAFFAFAMLAHHPECTAKMGDGLQAIRWGTNPEFPDTKCFLAMRKDGTEAGFSYRKCIDSAFNNISRRGEKRQREEHTTKFQPGLVVTVSGLPDEVGFRELKEHFGNCGNIKFADCRNGEGSLRFEDAAAAAKAVEVKELAGAAVSVKLLEGEAETEYWGRVHAAQHVANDRSRHGKGGKGKSWGKGKGKRRW